MAIFKAECKRFRRNLRDHLVYDFTDKETASEWLNDLTKVTKQSVAEVGWNSVHLIEVLCVLKSLDLRFVIQ